MDVKSPNLASIPRKKRGRFESGRFVSGAWLFVSLWLIAGASYAAEPFGTGDFHPTYSDRGWVNYELTRAELAGASICQSQMDLDHQFCYTGIHRFCGGRGYASGYGFESASDPNKVDIRCLGDLTVEVQGVHPDDITTANLPHQCTSSTDLLNPGLNCGVAIDRFCRVQAGFISGYGPVELGLSQTPPKVLVGCVKDTMGTSTGAIDMNTQPSLLSCTAAAATDDPCRQAMDEYCDSQDPDLRGGYGPGELVNNINNKKIRIACVRKDVPWEGNTTLPEAPSHPVDILDRDLKANGTEFDGPNHNELFGYRGMSFDGRLILRPTTVGGVAHVGFQIQTPEIFETPLSQTPIDKKDQSTAGGIYSENVIATDFHGSTQAGVLDIGSSLICDPHNPKNLMTPPLEFPDTRNRQQSVPARTSNPYACNANGDTGNLLLLDHDCYDVTVFSVFKSSSPTGIDDFWAKKVTVVVTNPKKSVPNSYPTNFPDRARVVLVKDDPNAALPVKAPSSWGSLLEPTMTGDGRLIIAQVDGYVKYATIPEGEDACDISKLSAFKDIWQMHSDKAMEDYGLSKYPLRDTEGNILDPNSPNGAALRGAYPWVDRDGDTLLFAAGRGSLWYRDVNDQAVVKSLYPVLGHPVFGQSTGASNIPLIPSVSNLLNDRDEGHVDILSRLGLSFVGLWTNGKLVTPDNRNNAADMGIPATPPHHRLLELYENEQTEVGGSVRTKVASMENQYFLLPNLRPDTPREVVWSIASQRQTDEFAFDDVLDPDALIISTMGTSIQNTGQHWGQFRNGYVPHGALALFIGEGFTKPSHIANQATSVSQEVADNAASGVDLSANVRWNTPGYGLLLGGARAEPIAAGGFDGRGLWLDGVDDRLEFMIPEQPTSSAGDFSSATWFTHISVDPRDLGSRRRLITFPDGSWLDLVGATRLKYGATAGGLGQVDLPSTLYLGLEKWTSIGLVSSLDGGGTLRFYVDGYLFAEHVLGAAYFRPEAGIVRVGDTLDGFKGWVDDFKVIAREPNPEVICNHARGTIVRVGSGDPLHTLASAYPAGFHADLRTNFLPGGEPTDKIYACERPIQNPTTIYAADDHANYTCLGQTRRPDSLTRPEDCLRETLLLAPVHTPVFWDLPRPDLAAVPFCTSCHVGSHPSETLDVTNALGLGIGPAKDDIRRQPMQSSPEINGNVPQGYFGLEPMMSFQTLPDGEDLDPYVAPASPP